MNTTKLRDTSLRIGKDETLNTFTEIGDVRLTLIWRGFAHAEPWPAVPIYLRIQVFDGPEANAKLLPGIEIPVHNIGTLANLFSEAIRSFGKWQEGRIEGLMDECMSCGNAEFHYAYHCGEDYPADEADDSQVLPNYAEADYEAASGWGWVSVKDMDREPGARWVGAAIIEGRDYMYAYCDATGFFGCGQEAGIMTRFHRLGVVPPLELQYRIFDRAEAKRLAADRSWQMPTPSAQAAALSARAQRKEANHV
jgi:hypothetical protein